MGNSKENRARRNELFAQDPHCYWCTDLTVCVEMDGGTFPMNAATLDHVFSRYTPHLRTGEGNPTVLACWKCNNRRSREETEALPIWELWRRADAYPLGWSHDDATE